MLGRAAPGRWVAGPPLRGRLCSVYLPAGHRSRRRAPLLMLLHGCDQEAEEFVDATRFTAVADRHGIVIVAPEQTRRDHPNRCWRWYEARNQERGRGEPAALADVATAMLDEQARWRIDPRRVYVAGLSAGGAMALVLAATYPDLFAGVGVHSAPPYRSATGPAGSFGAMAARGVVPDPAPGAPPLPPAVIVQGMADRVVAPANGTRWPRSGSPSTVRARCARRSRWASPACAPPGGTPGAAGSCCSCGWSTDWATPGRAAFPAARTAGRRARARPR
jgi:poly(hydroxyalkanoate) depolymerase family esterase